MSSGRADDASQYDFELPDELIARYPARKRDQSRLMVVNRANCEISHHLFSEFPDFLHKNDLMIVNDSKVFKARINAKRPSGGNVELLLVRHDPERRESANDRKEYWQAMARPSGRIKPGERLLVEPDGETTAIERIGEGRWIVAFDNKSTRQRIIDHSGHVPLPPYMRRGDEPTDLRRYQTVYARPDAVGSVAAPTAGFHFTKGLLAKLKTKGIRQATVTLHVGPGTFIPVHTESLSQHVMEAEHAELSIQTVHEIERARKRKGRIVVVGTTTVRTLEAATVKNSLPIPYSGPVNLFIRPGHQFKTVDSLLTNFHLPKSTLLVLVSSFAGRGLIRTAYKEAIQESYRFYSYGDAMLIL